MKKIIILIFCIAVVGVVMWQWDTIMGTQNSEKVSPGRPCMGGAPVKVITQPVTITSNDRSFEAIGTGKARLSAGIYPAVSEEVTEVLFKAQQNVTKGDVLVQLDDRAEKLAVQLAEVEVKDAKRLLGRYEQAVKEGAVPESEVDSARASFESAQVALEQANLALEERQIKAPFDGIVGIPNVDPGDRVGPDTLITGLDARETLFVDFEVPEALAGALNAQNGQTQIITATTPAYLSLNFDGHISAQESRVDPVRRTLLARASIENGDDLLRPGMSFSVIWDIPGKDYPTVPEISLQWGRSGAFIWVIREGKAVKVPVEVVARKAGQVLLDGELRGTDNVVVEGLQRLRPDMGVEVLGTAAP